MERKKALIRTLTVVERELNESTVSIAIVVQHTARMGVTDLISVDKLSVGRRTPGQQDKRRMLSRS